LHRAAANNPRSVGRVAIKVFVGYDPTAFVIHSDLVTATSGFFKNALNGGSSEAKGEVFLKTQDPVLFAIYVDWLYSETSALKLARLGSGQPDLFNPTKDFAIFSNLTILADFIQDEDFGNTVVDGAIRYFEQTNEALPDLLDWSHLPPTSKMRNLLVDFWVYCGMKENYPSFDFPDAVEAPHHFWVRVSRGQSVLIEHLNQGGNIEKPWVDDRCQYHEHENGEKCED
jgi:hypothetical protein